MFSFTLLAKAFGLLVMFPPIYLIVRYIRWYQRQHNVIDIDES